MLHVVSAVSALADVSGLSAAEPASTEGTAGLLADASRPAAQTQPDLLPLAQALNRQLNGLLPGVHRLSFEQGRVLLTLLIGDVQTQLREQNFAADSVVLNAGAADLLDIYTLKAVARRCRRGTLLVSPGGASNKAGLADGLRQCGFQVSGDPSSLQARFDPPWENSKKQPPSALQAPSSALVIGAGLAGACTAASLARRGWRVTVLDAGAAMASGASGLPAGLMAPHTSPDDSWLSRLSRSGLRATWQAATELLEAGRDYAVTGVLQRRLDPAESGALPDIWPSDGEAWSRPANLADLQAIQPDTDPGAIWHAAGGWIKPARLVQAMLAQPGIELRLGVSVARLEQISSVNKGSAGAVDRLPNAAPNPQPGWRALGSDGQTLAEADLVVLAAGFDSAALAQQLSQSLPTPLSAPIGAATSKASQAPEISTAALPLQAIRGQVSWGPNEGVVLPPFPVNGHGSFIPAFAGTPADIDTGASPRAEPAAEANAPNHWLMGATFERDQVKAHVCEADHAANLSRLQVLLPETAASLEASFKHGQVKAWAGVRCASPDRLPLVGPIDEAGAPGLWAGTALGSRGLTFAVLCGELLAAKLHAEPLPLAPKLAHALRASRFAERK